jgi:hypothetical protein
VRAWREVQISYQGSIRIDTCLSSRFPTAPQAGFAGDDRRHAVVNSSLNLAQELLAEGIQVRFTQPLGLKLTVAQAQQGEAIGLARMVENDQDAAPLGRSCRKSSTRRRRAILNVPYGVIGPDRSKSSRTKSLRQVSPSGGRSSAKSRDPSDHGARALTLGFGRLLKTECAVWRGRYGEANKW